MIKNAKKTSDAVNPVLLQLEEVRQATASLKAKQKAIIEEIRASFKDVVVVFIDMVDSTKYKVEHKNDPETWIRRVFLFSDLLTSYITALKGKVVKYIGDEVMAVFEGQACVNDANSFVARIDQIEKDLRDVIGDEIRIKISVDKGPVSLLKFQGHEETDPQGTSVDRCARIGKFAKASTVLASFDFVKDCPKTFQWTLVGETELKGLGRTKIFQMGDVTIDLTPIRELKEDEYQKLISDLASAERRSEDLFLENKKITEMNLNIQKQLREIGQKPKKENSVVLKNEPEKDPWDDIQLDIAKLQKLIGECTVPNNEYSRFLFLSESDSPDAYPGGERAFDASIEAKLVHEVDEGYYKLDESHPRNKAALKVMRSLAKKLEDYEQPEQDLFRYSLDDPDFWRKKIGFYVL